MNKQKSLAENYKCLIKKLDIEESVSGRRVNEVIKKTLGAFCKSHKNPAIWCYGKHTKMLMMDFIYEMKNVKIIIDTAEKSAVNNGFHIIMPDQIERYKIDGIIISSYVYKEEIKEKILRDHKETDYLDIYEELALNGMIFRSSYFSASHPCNKYQLINELQIRYSKTADENLRKEFLEKIIKEYIIIKDFLNAIKYLKIIISLEDTKENREFLAQLTVLYETEKRMISEMNPESVLMLCIDGFRRKDLLIGKLPKLWKWIMEHGYFFENAYSSSTSTYESLIPVYGFNNNMKTKYYEREELEKEECSFIKEACRQNRKIYFYTDGARYVNCSDIKYSGISQTATEKIWDFAIDTSQKGRGLFYLHILYESHYSYSNPYTTTTLVAEGSNIMFDFLETKGGKLQTNYGKQQTDALKYIDDILMPFLELIPCRIVLYADHGNILMTETDTLRSIERTKFTCHKDLIEIPLVIKCPELSVQRDKRLISLMELNKMICCLLNDEKYDYTESEYIKIQRSEIYNPDFCYLYKKNGREKELQAFELFIFRDGVQLMIYADGTIEEIMEDGRSVEDKWDRLKCVEEEITVCSKEDIANRTRRE